MGSNQQNPTNGCGENSGYGSGSGMTSPGMVNSRDSSSNGGQINDPRPNDFTELANVENASDKYLETLKAEEALLQKKVDEIIQKVEKRQERIFQLESKITVTKDKIQELGIVEIQKKIEEQKEAIESAKGLHEQTSAQALETSKNVNEEIKSRVNEFEKRRLEFKTQKGVVNSVKTKLVQSDQYRQKVQDAEKELSELTKSLEEANNLIKLEDALIILTETQNELGRITNSAAQYQIQPQLPQVENQAPTRRPFTI